MSSTLNYPNNIYRSLGSTVLLALALAATPRVGATGDWNSIYLLPNHEFAAIAAPEFWFELEMKDLARGYQVKEKSEKKLTTGEAELASFDAALAAKKVKSGEAKAIRKRLQAGRALLDERTKAAAEEQLDVTTEPGDEAAKPKAMPEKLPIPEDNAPTNEFELYQLGALHYANGDEDKARESWDALLALPADDRHYRTVWAEYMMGRMEMEDPEKAASHFSKVRKLAKTGFDDPLGLAAASYGWEAFALKKEAPEKALELYLKQLATGDLDAFASIKQLTRETFFGPLYGEEADKEMLDPKRFEKASRSPLLRQILTRWHLAMGMDVHTVYYTEDNTANLPTSAATWLSLLEKSSDLEDGEADRMAWLAYQNGAHDQAKRWLKLASKETKLSLWLTAKLALRDGKTDEAAAAITKATELFTEPEKLQRTSTYLASEPLKNAAKADAALILLNRGKFIESMTTFISAGHWRDAAWIAERVLTLEELKKFVDDNYPKGSANGVPGLNYDALGAVVKSIKRPKSKADAPDPADDEPGTGEDEREMTNPDEILTSGILQDYMEADSPKAQEAIAWRLRWLLARRMVREDQEKASRPYFPNEMQPVLDVYLAAITTGAKKDGTPESKARAWWEAAWIARYAGLELMGTEMEPDNVWEGGSFECPTISTDRLLGTAVDMNADTGEANAKQVRKKIKFGLAPSAEEKKRLEKSKLPHENRHHYRWVAAALAKKAAALMKDGSEEKADVLNCGGSWLFDRDVKGEEAIFFEIKRACPKTKIGKAVLAKGHTYDLGGPWSGPLRSEDAEESSDDATPPPAPEPEPEPEAGPKSDSTTDAKPGKIPTGKWQDSTSGLYVFVDKLSAETDTTTGVVVASRFITVGGKPPKAGKADDIFLPSKSSLDGTNATLTGKFNWDTDNNLIELKLSWNDGTPTLEITKNAGYARFKKGTYTLESQ